MMKLKSYAGTEFGFSDREMPYGTRVHEHTIGNIHDHLSSKLKKFCSTLNHVSTCRGPGNYIMLQMQMLHLLKFSNLVTKAVEDYVVIPCSKTRMEILEFTIFWTEMLCHTAVPWLTILNFASPRKMFPCADLYDLLQSSFRGFYRFCRYSAA